MKTEWLTTKLKHKHTWKKQLLQIEPLKTKQYPQKTPNWDYKRNYRHQSILFFDENLRNDNTIQTQKWHQNKNLQIRTLKTKRHPLDTKLRLWKIQRYTKNKSSLMQAEWLTNPNTKTTEKKKKRTKPIKTKQNSMKTPNRDYKRIKKITDENKWQQNPNTKTLEKKLQTS